MKAGYSSILNTLIHAAGTTVKGKIGYRALCDGIDFDVGLEYIDILLKAGADPNYSLSPDRDFLLTPIQMAAWRGNLPALSLLVEYGADVNAFDPHLPAGVSNATALQFAALHGNLQMAGLLLESGADINAPPADRDGRTTLEGAAEHGRLEMVHMLLTREPKLKIAGSYRIHFLRAVDLAHKRGHREVAEYLKLHGEWNESDERETEVNPRVFEAGIDREWTGEGDDPRKMKAERRTKKSDKEKIQVGSARPGYPADPIATAQSEDGIHSSHQQVGTSNPDDHDFQVPLESAVSPGALQEAVDFYQGQPFQQPLESGHYMEIAELGDVTNFSEGFDYHGYGHNVNAGGELTMMEHTSWDDELLFNEFLNWQESYIS